MKKYSVTVCFLLSLATSIVTCSNINIEGKIAGDRTISECINGYLPTMINRDPKMYISTSEYIRQMGYPAEEHLVQTDDGHLLTIHRIPGEAGSPPIFLQHGFLASSFDWVVIGKDKALAFKLADEGYDVWLGNVRGNTYSRCHARYRTSDYRFWDFSWHEIGIYDLPAMITHVTTMTGQKIIYIGHSMGTTSFYVMAIERPNVASNVKVMISLAPVAYIDHANSPFRIFSRFTRQLEFFSRARGTAEIFSQTPALKTLLKYGCTLTMLQRRICANLILSGFGFDSKRFNYTLVPEILYHAPAGSSMKIFIHYYQEQNSGKFQNYDHGEKRNLQLYNNTKPPEYDISKINVPVAVISSDSDVFANPTDVTRLYKQLPNKILYYRVEDPNFNHLDHLYAMDAPKHVYSKVLSVIDNYK